jgi:CO/xanthine dehydrogenase Mo-binding subunit
VKVVGQELPRVEILEKVTGQSLFGADMGLAGPILCGKILHSPHAHARIKRIDTTGAERLTGVKAVITARDLPSVRYGNFVKDEEYFACTKVRYVGDRVAAVAAVDEETAREALRLIELEYELLPSLMDGLEAIREGAPLIHEDFAQYEVVAAGMEGLKGNVCAHKRVVQGDVERGFREADKIFEHRFYTPMVHQTYMEPHAVLARVDASGKATVWVPTQAQFPLRAAIAEILRMPMTRVRVIPTEVGGGFGGKIAPTIEPAAIELARKSRMAVRILMSRAEDFQCATPRHPCHMRYKTGVMLDGTLVGREIELVFATGASLGIGAIIAQSGALRAPGPYRIPHLKIDSACVYTNTSSCAAYRAPAGPQLAFASESQIDIIARELGIDPVEIRLRNAAEEGDKIPTGITLRDVHVRETLLRAAAAIEWKKKPPEKNRGRGIAIAHWLVGGMASTAGVKLNEDGTVAVMTGVVDLSGAVTSVAQIVAEVLGVSLADVQIRTADTDFAPHSTQSSGSQALRSVGGAAKLAAEDVRRQITEVAADNLEAEPADLVVEEKMVYVRGSREKALTLGEVARLSLSHKRGPIVSAQSLASFPTQPAFTTHVADVEVDEQTGRIKILRYIAVQDVGKAINPLSVRGQIEGGVVQGIGQAMSEVCKFANGRMENPNFLDYKIPSSLDVPRIEVHLVEHDAEGGPFGAKGVGEPPIIPPPAVIANAVADAVGVRIHDLPLTPEKVLKALGEKNRA